MVDISFAHDKLEFVQLIGITKRFSRNKGNTKFM